MSEPEAVDLSEQMRDRRDREPLLDRVQKIGAPVYAALASDRTDADGDEPQPDVDREIVATAMRRLLALCEDIEAGLYTNEESQNGEI